MRYEVKLMNRNFTGEDKVVFRTEGKKEAFDYACKTKKHENNTPINEYDDVAVFDNGECITKIKLY